MLRRKFELILIKVGCFYKFLKLLKNQAIDPVLLQGVWPNFVKND